MTDLNSKSTVSYTLREAVHTDAVCQRDDQVEVNGQISVRTQRYEDALTIQTSVKCNFDCMRDVDRVSSKCNGNGDFACGVCQCDAAHFGVSCQFDKPECPPGQAWVWHQDSCNFCGSKPLVGIWATWPVLSEF